MPGQRPANRQRERTCPRRRKSQSSRWRRGPIRQAPGSSQRQPSTSVNGISTRHMGDGGRAIRRPKASQSRPTEISYDGCFRSDSRALGAREGNTALCKTWERRPLHVPSGRRPARMSVNGRAANPPASGPSGSDRPLVSLGSRESRRGAHSGRSSAHEHCDSRCGKHITVIIHLTLGRHASWPEIKAGRLPDSAGLNRCPFR